MERGRICSRQFRVLVVQEELALAFFRELYAAELARRLATNSKGCCRRLARASCGRVRSWVPALISPAAAVLARLRRVR
jgi:hypothetical protein